MPEKKRFRDGAAVNYPVTKFKTEGDKRKVEREKARIEYWSSHPDAEQNNDAR